jgi:hypothetical protein
MLTGRGRRRLDAKSVAIALEALVSISSVLIHVLVLMILCKKDDKE